MDSGNSPPSRGSSWWLRRAAEAPQAADHTLETEMAFLAALSLSLLYDLGKVRVCLQIWRWGDKHSKFWSKNQGAVTLKGKLELKRILFRTQDSELFLMRSGCTQPCVHSSLVSEGGRQPQRHPEKQRKELGWSSQEHGDFSLFVPPERPVNQ